MAFVVDRPSGNIEVVVYRDRAVRCTKKDYDGYTKSFETGCGDESLLKLEGEPTRFVIRPELTWQQKQKLRTKNIKLIGKKALIDANYSSELLRLHLVGIKNPSTVPAEKCLTFEKDGDDGAARALMNKLDDAQVIGDLVGALQAVRGGPEDDREKNS